MELDMINIAIDVDDCICNTVEMDYACAYYLYKKYNKVDKEFDSTYFDVVKTFDFSKDLADKFFMTEKQFIMKHTSMYPKIFAKEVVNKLMEKGFNIYFVSSRLDKYFNGNSTKYLKKWLKKYKIKYTKAICGIPNKVDTLKELNVDLMIEDRVDFVKSMNDANIKTILIKQPYNSHYHNPLNNIAENWLDLYVLLGNMYNFRTDDIIDFTN